MFGLNKIITVLGPTATGKTNFAAHLASTINAEIISADSRQVYRGMNLGTGKDLDDYFVNGVQIPYHLIDIVDPGYEYNIYEFQRDFFKAYEEISIQKKPVIMCGGTGMYLESVLKGYNLVEVPENLKLRKSLNGKSDENLSQMLKKYKNIHNVSDISDRSRLIRAIEIQDYLDRKPSKKKLPILESLNFGISFDRETLKRRITERLKSRLKHGMIEEIRSLIEKGTKPESLIFYGLEYKFFTQYVIGELSFDEMLKKLEIAIHQFSKRQMTWFRRMEKQGVKIHWIDGSLPMTEKTTTALTLIKKTSLLNH